MTSFFTYVSNFISNQPDQAQKQLKLDLAQLSPGQIKHNVKMIQLHHPITITILKGQKINIESKTTHKYETIPNPNPHRYAPTYITVYKPTTEYKNNNIVGQPHLLSSFDLGDPDVILRDYDETKPYPQVTSLIIYSDKVEITKYSIFNFVTRWLGYTDAIADKYFYSSDRIFPHYFDSFSKEVYTFPAGTNLYLKGAMVDGKFMYHSIYDNLN